MNPAIEELINERVAAAIAANEANRTNGGGEGSAAAGGQGTIAQGCSYKEFIHCKPMNFSGKEGTVGLVHWFKKMESVFRISNCAENNKVKYSTCTLLEGALTWWNTYAQSVGIDAAYSISWEELRQMMTEEYCPRNELQKLETELWNLKVKGTDLTGYTIRFQELALLCPNMVTPEYVKVERYIEGLPHQIKGMVTSSNPATIQAAIRMANKLMDQTVQQGTLIRNDVRNVMQHSNKRQKVDGQNVRKGYIGNHPYCNRCNKHHTGPCICERCQKTGHVARNCRNPAPVTKAIAPEGCYKCGEVGHFKRNCPKIRKQNAGPAEGKVYMITNGEDHQDSD